MSWDIHQIPELDDTEYFSSIVWMNKKYQYVLDRNKTKRSRRHGSLLTDPVQAGLTAETDRVGRKGFKETFSQLNDQMDHFCYIFTPQMM
jgi:hypothetical protein